MNKLSSHLRRNDGMSMIEMTVAITLGAIILTAGAGTLASAMGGVNFSRQNQQSAALISEIIEETRGMNYGAVSVKRDTAALAADTRLTNSGGVYSVDPDGTGPLVAEQLVLSDTGGVPLSRTLERNGTKYAVSTYVTTPAGADADFRRVTTVVKWTKGNKTSERRSASFVTNTRRGLPLPNFSVAFAQTASVNAGAQLQLPIQVTNSGARDAWNMTATTSPTRPWNVVFYADNAPAGSFGAEDTALADSDGNGKGDTGLLDTDQVKKMWAIADIPTTDAAGVVTTKLTATSASDPDFAESVDDKVTVLAQSCAGCTFVPYYMKNAGGSILPSTLQPTMTLETSAPGAYSGVPNYDTDKNEDPGRTLEKGGTDLLEPDATKIALWEATVSGTLKLNGTANATLVLQPKSFDPSKDITVRVYLAREKTNGVVNQEGTMGEKTFRFSTPGFSQITIPIAVSNVQFTNNQSLQVRVLLPDGNDSVFLAYGTADYAASIVLPKV